MRALALVFAMLAASLCAQVQKRGVELAPAAGDRSQTKYIALVIGNDNYQHVAHLTTAVSDAQEVSRLLTTQFGFESALVLNGTRDLILSTLNDYRRSLSPQSAFLIYYAGHGVFDRDAQKAYWLPVDAAADDNTRWISADDITTDMKVLPARQILVVSDSCYSGALSRDVPIEPGLPAGDRARFFQNIRQRGPSRILLSSGGNEPVADTGGGSQHSVFASAFLRGLANMKDTEFTVEELFSGYVREAVAGRSGQVPECTPLRNSGHDSGTFIFERHWAPVVANYRARAVPASLPPPAPGTRRIMVGGTVQQANLISAPQPTYPPQAQKARIQGVVRLNAVIGKDGAVRDVRLAAGHPMLAPAAIDAVSKWRYKQTLLSGEPVEVQTTIDVNFKLDK